MNEISNIIAHLLEAEEDEEGFTVKELVEPGEEGTAGPTTVKRYGRMKLVDMERYAFLISYLTPVAYRDKVFNTYYRTTKHWSPTTERHLSDWQSMIYKSPEWANNPRNLEPSDYRPGTMELKYPRFKYKTQTRISALFRSLIPSMEIKPHMKRRMYHVDPQMRLNAPIQGRIGYNWSGHLRHHPTGAEGLPRPHDPGFAEFFRDFDPDVPEEWDWDTGEGRRSGEPRERYKPDEE